MHTYFATFLILVTTVSVSAQNNLDRTLSSVREKNKTIIAAKQNVATAQLGNHAGLTPENPSVSADYLIGRPVEGGDQFDFTITQGFDFPTVYSHKKNMANQQDELSTIGLSGVEQEVLLEAKITYLELIHLNRQKQTLEKRTANSTELVANYQKKYDAEQLSGLELNKAKLQLLNFQSELRTIESQVEVKTQHLTELNGGLELSINDLVYPVEPVVPDFNTLEALIEEVDPQLLWLNQQAVMNQTQVKIRKAMALPKLETGYHYQSVLGQVFNGIHFGLTIPIWEHKNTVKHAGANVQLTNLRLEEHKVEHYFEIKELYHNYETMKKMLTDYSELLDGLNSEEILNKSLELGEIDFITYVMELQYYYTFHDQLRAVEKDYQVALAKLFRHEL